VLEHITTREGVQFVEAHPGRLGGTITPHHLSYNRNAIFKGGIRPHFYCLPIAKREEHRLALRKAATSGRPAVLSRHRHRTAHRRHQGVRLRLRRRVQRAGGDAGLCPGLHGGECARQARGLRQPERPALLRSAAERGSASPSRQAADFAGAGRGSGANKSIGCLPPDTPVDGRSSSVGPGAALRFMEARKPASWKDMRSFARQRFIYRWA
jgi:hypothetical protein